ncbi:LysR family transcriptional regulator [Burkholderia vietnamiensis]|jgi:DNA-binding transcriptional LysR family regulator|uniref:LysR family transcriptional regulator n=6 Tax=Bacteria TaxID=2 RepID=A0A0H3KTT7_BURM1|nr:MULTISPECIES: LysR family transcriptional regulator [Burkholderia cepacia complex]ABO57297.1 transcriptional regulator, LysR family [Burkholderia vietnamiensis G4]ABX18437.1 transcriptional regulator, LysR family [Burkholderia multivorans ATCC 17616]AIO73121.1 bacterial regulatory helix-turn-helix, lysR family protein [Burkholderia multivorans]AMU14299.1 LysR family transcriptional regulator [Burkholderia cenocepacia]AOK64552.1 LysR family transcriptional regulator [Burkholderia multivorans
MNTRFLETFVWLATLKSFRLTADKLHATQGAVSSRIASLEQDLGVRLFDRGSKEVTLTRDGSKALKYAERILSLAEEMRSDLGDPDRVSGIVRIGVIESIVHSWLSGLITRLGREFPNLTIELTSDTSLKLREQFLAGLLDIILQTDVLAVEHVSNVELGKLSMSWVSSPSLGLSGEALEDTDLAAFPIVSFSRGSGPHRSLENYFRNVPSGPPKINCVTSVAAIIKLTVDGFGIAVLPRAIIRPELENGQLALLNVSRDFPDLELVGSYRAGVDSLLIERIASMSQETAREFARKSGRDVATFGAS